MITPVRTAAGLVALAAAAALGVPGPALASDATVRVGGAQVGPRVVQVSLDGTVTWDFTGHGPQTSTSDQGFWSSDPTRAGQSFDQTFTSAGRFAYHSRDDASLRGAVAVPVRETGSPEHGYQLRWSTVPGGHRTAFDVQSRPAGGTWTPLATHTTADGGSFDPGTPGRYQVRARTDRGSSRSGRSGWSPTVTVSIT